MENEKSFLNNMEEEFTFECEVSAEGIDHKPSKAETGKIRYSMKAEKLTLPEYREKVKSGYTVVPCRWGKENCIGKSVQMVVFDIDESDMDLDDFVDTLNDEPSFWYHTFSSGNVIKFRLVYIFDRPFPSGYYNNVYYWLLNRNSVMLDTVKNDTHNSVPWQPVFGTSHEVYGIGILHEVPDFVPEYVEEAGENRMKCETAVKDAVKDVVKDENAFIKSFWEDYNDMPLKDFYLKYMQVYGDIVYRETVYLPEDEDERILYPIGPYYKVDLPWRRNGSYLKWKDGENRHGKLYMSGIKFRIIYKEINGADLDREFLTYLLVRELILYYDNSDKKFIKKPLKHKKGASIVEIVDNVMKYQICIKKEGSEVIEYNLKPDKGGQKYKINIAYCRENDIPTKALNAIIRNEMSSKTRVSKKLNKYMEFDKYYDPALSIRENVKNLKSHGVNTNIAAIQRYLKYKATDSE